jgi:DNA-binding protein H-NS
VKTRGRKKTTAKKRKVAPKYRLVVDGQEYLWSGRGRAPKVFKDYMDSGKSKESCAIK